MIAVVPFPSVYNYDNIFLSLGGTRVQFLRLGLKILSFASKFSVDSVFSSF